MSEQGHVKSDIKDGIGVITFFHPRGNSLPGTLLRSIAQSIQTLGKNSDVRVIVLKSEGDKVFCGGASFDELLAVKTSTEGLHFFMGFAEIILAVKACPKFVIARVQGKAVGGAVGVISACDYALAVDTASIRLSEFALGFGPFVISAAVHRKLGLSAFQELTIDADWRDAAWAQRHGLYAQIYSSIAALDEGLNMLTKRMAQSNPEAMKHIKQILWEGTEQWPELLKKRATISSELIMTDFVQSAVNAVNKK